MRRILLLIAAALVLVAAPASGFHVPSPGRVVSEDPADWTPHVLDGEVRAMLQVDDTVIVGGDFTTVANAGRTREVERWFLFAFDLQTGRILDWAPWLDGPVLALAEGRNGTVFVGGAFTNVGGRKQRGIAELDLRTGRPTDVRTSIDSGDVRTMAAADGYVYVGGTFSEVDNVPRRGVARLFATDGRVDPEFDAQLSSPDIGRVKVEDLAVSPDGDRLVVIGAMTMAGSEHRVQVAMFDLSRTRARLADWWTNSFNAICRRHFDTYLRGVDFSPDGKYLVIVTTGQYSSPDLLCDAAARFETYVAGEVKPTWVNHTGGDSLYSVLVMDDAVYVGGHQRWMNNPHGREDAGPGAVDRQGLAAVDPETGEVTPWDPSHSRGVGVRELAMTDAGLLVGSDSDKMGGEYHGKLGLLPY
jgi:hypothetical protein